MSDSSDSSKTVESRRGGEHDNVTRRARRVHESTDRPSYDLPVKLKVPKFSPDEPEIWFALLEGQFDNYGITDDASKFSNVLSNLDITTAKEVKDIITNPPLRNKYQKLKNELIRRLTASIEKKMRQVLTHEQLGDRKPSQFLRHLQDLAGPNFPDDFLRTIWCDRLPRDIQTVLASQTSQSLEQLAELADRVQDLTVPAKVASASTCTCSSSGNFSNEIAELKLMVARLEAKLEDRSRVPPLPDRSRPRRRRSSSRSRTRSTSSYRRSPICWYHINFGTKARRCIQPCDYKPAGNAMGSR
ncbi:uncharacterized protein LOC119189835 [Manduca sexta]|uniref:uncharacterized protein LOC119189835 n=1 Tax=Manduca sexta TaxID=7130 RepID=UPI00188E7F1D|nr:uncharacterized protein LOC119189835 [Manduca sexta]